MPFPRGLRELGYIEGRDVIVEWRSADGRNDRMPALAAEMVGRDVDIIVAGGPETREAAMEATSTIPIVVVGGVDPIGQGWAASFARPGGNVTGSTVTHPGLSGKRLEFLKEIIPGLSRVAVIRDAAAGLPAPESMVAMRAAGDSLRVDPRFIDVRRQADFDEAFRQAIRGGGGFSRELWSRRRRPAAPRRDVRRQDPRGRTGGRLARGAAEQVRAGRQPQDCEGRSG